MANKQKHIKPTNEDVRTAEHLMKAGAETVQRKLDVLQKKYDDSMPAYRTLGMLQRGRLSREFEKIVDHYTLYQIKKSGSYKAVGDWAYFCKAAGLSVRTVDDALNDTKALMDELSAATAECFGVTFNEFKLLGRGVSAGAAETKGNQIVILGRVFSATPDAKADIQAAIHELEETLHDKEKNLKVTDRRIGDKEKEIQKRDKIIDGLEDKLQARAKAREMTPREDQFLALLTELKTSFHGYVFKVEPTTIDLTSDDSPMMRASFIELLGNMRRQLVALHDTAVEMFGADLEDAPAWKPGE